MSWWSESGVIDKGDMQNVQCWGAPGTSLGTTDLDHLFVKTYIKFELMVALE